MVGTARRLLWWFGLWWWWLLLVVGRGEERVGCGGGNVGRMHVELQQLTQSNPFSTPDSVVHVKLSLYT